MAAQTPTTEPARIFAGDTAQWLISLADYPASDGWALVYTLINSDTRYSFTSSASGDDHLVLVAASATERWASGSYSWRCQAVLGAEKYTVRSGTLEVTSSYSDTDIDARSHARRTLAAIEAYLENANNLTAAKYEIAGRSLQRMPIPDLLALRDRYVADVAREDAAQRVGQGLPDKRRVLVRFGP